MQEVENGSPAVNYIRTLIIDEPLARIESNGTIRFYQTDALGSVIALTDTDGTVRTQYVYDPFGNTTVSGEISDNPFQYTGRENDQPVLSGVEGGLYYYRARYYNPELQRFVSEDPIGEAKEFMGLRRAKFRRLKYVREQVVMTAAAQNIKRLVKHLTQQGPKRQAKAARQALYSSIRFFSQMFAMTLCEYGKMRTQALSLL